MAFTVGTATFTNGSTSVTNVTLTSGVTNYFGRGTRMVIGVNPLIAEVEAIAAPTQTTITLADNWSLPTGTYSFLANMTSEGVRDAVQAIRASAQTLQEFIDSIDVQNTNDSVVQRTANGRVKTSNATESNDAVALGQIPNSAPSALYGRSNILGTVSQSGGVPTGAIMQRGSNANGEFVRYADGTLICWNTDVTGSDVVINESDGNVFVSAPISFTPPSAFVGMYYVSCGSDGARNWGGGAPSTGSSVSFRIFRATTTTVGRAKAFAIGRWY